MIKAKKSEALGGLIFGAYIEMNKEIYENCINVFRKKYDTFDMYYSYLEKTMYAYTTALVMDRLTERGIKEKYILNALKVSHSLFLQAVIKEGEETTQDVINSIRELILDHASIDIAYYDANPNYRFDEVRFLIIDAYMIEYPSDAREELSEILCSHFIAMLKELDSRFKNIIIK